MSMTLLNIVIICGFCGSVLEVEEQPERIEGLDVIGVVRHQCEDEGK